MKDTFPATRMIRLQQPPYILHGKPLGIVSGAVGKLLSHLLSAGSFLEGLDHKLDALLETDPEFRHPEIFNSVLT